MLTKHLEHFLPVLFPLNCGQFYLPRCLCKVANLNYKLCIFPVNLSYRTFIPPFFFRAQVIHVIVYR